MKILFTGGGTGGHIFPIIAIAREIRRIYSNGEKLEFFYIGPEDQFASILFSQEGIKVKKIMAGKIRRYFDLKSLFQNIIDLLFKIPIGFFQAFFYIFFLAPDLIFSKGGYGSIPAVLAGWILWVPIFLHESDATPGLSNRFLSKFALKVFVSFAKTEYFPPKKMILTGNPIRKELLAGSKEEAKNLFKLSYQKPIILILGGSQGAQRINDLILVILPDLLGNFEIIHQCGEKNLKEVKVEANVVIPEELKNYYHLFPFLKETELAHAFAACDLIVSRAGSGSIFEILATGKPSILIPLPEAAQNHQLKNAYSYAETGATTVIEEENLKPFFFLERIKYLLSHPIELENMAKKSGEFAKPEAAREIAENIVGHYLSK